MRLTCPVCDYVESRAHRAWRLELCPRCHEEGREIYLTDSATEPGRARPRIHAVTGLARAAERMRAGEAEPLT